MSASQIIGKLSLEMRASRHANVVVASRFGWIVLRCEKGRTGCGSQKLLRKFSYNYLKYLCVLKS